jgi:hypothetical protein
MSTSLRISTAALIAIGVMSLLAAPAICSADEVVAVHKETRFGANKVAVPFKRKSRQTAQ